MNFAQIDLAGYIQFIKKFLCYIFLGLFLFGCSDYSADSLKSTGTSAEESSIETNPQIEHAQNSVWQIYNKSIINEEFISRKFFLNEKISSPVTGTAFSIGSNLFVTNFHNMLYILEQDPSANIILQQKNNPFQLTVSQIHAASALYDLVIFETKENTPYYLSIEKGSPQPDEELLALGYPEWKFRKIKKTGKTVNKDPYYIFPVNHFFLAGASGSPVLNSKARVVGVLFAAAGNISFAVKSQKLKDLVEGNKELNCSDKTDLAVCIKKELENLKNSAEQGNAQAQYNLGVLYANKPGKKPDWKSVFKWKKKAADQSHFLAQLEVAQMYSSGQGVEPNQTVAFQWVQKSAKQGHIIAQLEVAQMYSSGQGVEPNQAFASQWMHKSAEQGNAQAQNEVGKKYYERWKIHKDQELFNSAFNWFQQSAKQGYPVSQYYLAKMYRVKDNKTMQDFLSASEWMHKSAERNYPLALYELAEMYANNEILIINSNNEISTINPEHKKSMIFYWLSKSAEQGHAQAQYELAVQYFNKQGKTDTDEELAFFWMEKSANQGYVYAQYDLGKMYFGKKDKTEEDINWGFHWLEQAAYQEYPIAKYSLGNQYNKYGYPKEGLYWLNEASKQNVIWAYYDLGLILENHGKMEDAIDLMTIAADNGLGKAKEFLEKNGRKNIQD